MICIDILNDPNHCGSCNVRCLDTQVCTAGQALAQVPQWLAAGASTVIILIILAGIKPLEEAYRSRNQSCQLKVEVDNGNLTPELLRSTLDLRAGQVKRFLVENRNPDGTDALVILLSKVSSQDIATYPEKLKELDGVREVTIMKRAKDRGANLT